MNEGMKKFKVIKEWEIMIEEEIIEKEGVELDKEKGDVDDESRKIVGIEIGEMDLKGEKRGDGRRRVGEIKIDEIVKMRNEEEIIGIGGKLEILIGKIFVEFEREG